MKLIFRMAVIATTIFSFQLATAQAPAGATGVCKDGTYSTAAKKAGACGGHKGVQTWYADTKGAPAAAKPAATPAAAPAPAKSSAMAMTPAPATSSAPMKKMAPNAVAAPGGGPGMVWVNTESKVYHCPGSDYYGKTKTGKYMSESDAKAAGAHGDHGKTCSK
jgi:hypothetical protein